MCTILCARNLALLGPLGDRAALRKHNIKKTASASARRRVKKNTEPTEKLCPLDGSSAKKNFNIYYELDGEEVGTALRADEYGGDEDFPWVMLEPDAAAAKA